jgi:hypothetical protein
MLTQGIFAGVGLIITLLLGWFCECFLRKSVTAQPRLSWHEAGGGGKQLGVLERLLFFASFWLSDYTLAGGWLAFKVAGKWAAWQHVIKIPESEPLRERTLLSSRLLGRFLNGTLYNGLCAAVGTISAQWLSYFSRHLLTDTTLLPAALIVLALVIVLAVLTLCFDWPHFGEGYKEPPVIRTVEGSTRGSAEGAG